VLVVGNETDPLNSYLVIEFIPNGRLGLDDQAAQVDLANLVLEGAGSSEDPARTAHWSERAAASGDLVAAFNLGLCLAAEGVPETHMYGRMLTEGHGVSADPEAVRSWIARAAAAGLGEAQTALAEMMVNSRGGPRDTATALKLFEKAAVAGRSGAMFALGALHAGGHDLPEDGAARAVIVLADRADLA
jgi:hypothetical protein